MTETSQVDREHSELLLLYETSVSEIASFKQQQWTTTNYTLLVQAGLVAVGQILGNKMQDNEMQSSEKFILSILIALTAAFGLTVLSKLHHSIMARRDRLCRAREHFGEPFKSARSVPKGRDPVSRILSVTQVIGALVAGWLVIVWL
jgi:hypothetical protein